MYVLPSIMIVGLLWHFLINGLARDMEIDKATAKLIEVVASGIGAVAAPWLTRRNAKAEADRLRIVAKGEQDAKDILEGRKTMSGDGMLIEVVGGDQAVPISEMAEIRNRVEYQERKRHGNLRAITQEAAQHLEKQVSDEEVDPDWIARFFTYAQDVTREDMQRLWGKLLAGEVARPGSFTLQTLDIVRNLSSEDAKKFSALAPFVVADGIYRKADGQLRAAGFSYDELLVFDELGLLRTSFGLFKQFHSLSKENFTTIITFLTQKNSVLNVVREQPSQFLKFEAYLLTRSGREIISTFEGIEPNLDYLKTIARDWAKDGYKVQLLRPSGEIELT